MKRNIFLSVFLPLFLCAAILTLGYFSPMLFSRVMPNFKNKESCRADYRRGKPAVFGRPLQSCPAAVE